MNTPTRMLRICRRWNGTPIEPADQISVAWTEQGSIIELQVAAPFYGDPPAPNAPIGPTDRLWEHEVVEVFIAGPDSRYTEIELAPSGHHLVLQLDGVRQPIAARIPIEFHAAVEGNRWLGVARIPRTVMPPKPWRVNATAIHGSHDRREYLSMHALPGTEPDFHQPDLFQPLPD